MTTEIQSPVAPTRAELAKITKDPRTIKAFEKLFALVPSEFNAEKLLIQETLIDAGNANARAQQAIDELTAIARRAKSNEVLLWLSM